MICILFGIKIDPYFHNLGLLYENLKKAQFLWCVQNDVTVRMLKTQGTNNPKISNNFSINEISDILYNGLEIIF